MTTRERQLLTVPQVAEQFQVTAQTIRNWIDGGALPAVRVGCAFRVRSEDLDALLERASAESRSLATRRDVWTPTTSSPRRSSQRSRGSVWEGGDTDLPAKRR
ncbi:MAG: helix-turn-helix domain-containing protein [Actinobacteria bacterium]|nr:MAG: helix-turn-helix domain-containing protein [Actinomycetota bacterium]